MHTEVLLLRADDLNCNEVPTPMEPVLVTESEGLAGGALKTMSAEENK
jgi:hypothetical protein